MSPKAAHSLDPHSQDHKLNAAANPILDLAFQLETLSRLAFDRRLKDQLDITAKAAPGQAAGIPLLKVLQIGAA